MEAAEMAQHIHRIRKSYADAYDSMKWLTPETAKQASRVRDRLISDIFENPGAEWKFSRTKLIAHDISPGCSLCGQGDWSCLFINGICNARCFYCPSAQEKKGNPVTSTVEFPNAPDYVGYVNAFGIKGVSFSGGEPFLTFDKIMKFLKALRAGVKHPLYIWTYTNGLLVTEDKLKALRDNGLDEIRFDLSANHYKLDALEKAVGIIPRVTVEIPAIPEDLNQTKQVMADLCSAGADYLNLHQIRCTSFNRPKLMKRGYTFLHGPGVTVLETELAALELIRYAFEQKMALPINYCSFAYRHQYQKAGAQKRIAPRAKAPHEDITATGYIRTMSVWGDPEHIGALQDRLRLLPADPALWKCGGQDDHFFFSLRLWSFMDTGGLRLKIEYSGTSLRPSVSFRHAFKEVSLSRKRKVVVERYARGSVLWLEGEEIHRFASLFLGAGGETSTETVWSDVAGEIEQFESFSPGLSALY